MRIDVVGIGYRSKNMTKLIERGAIKVGTPARLVPEPTNPHDANAIQVVIDGEHVGYVARKDQASIATRKGWTVVELDTRVFNYAIVLGHE